MASTDGLINVAARSNSEKERQELQEWVDVRKKWITEKPDHEYVEGFKIDLKVGEHALKIFGTLKDEKFVYGETSNISVWDGLTLD